MSRLRRSLACGVATTAVLVGAGTGVAGAATLTVTTTTDSLASDGQCSLREAIAAANSPGTPGDCGTADALSNRIVLGPHAYPLSIKPAGEDDQTTGDLDVNPTAPPLTIEGAGVGSTQITGAQPEDRMLEDRIMHVLPGAEATLRDLTITEGRGPDGAEGKFATPGPSPMAATAGSAGFPGGGIRNGGTLALDNVAVTDNRAGNGGRGGSGFLVEAAGAEGGGGGAGGGIQNSGALKLVDVTVSGNKAGSGGLGGEGGMGVEGFSGGNGGCCGDGGGLDNAGGTVEVLDSTFSGNRAGDGGSGGRGGGGSLAFGGTGGTGAGGSSGGGIASAGGSISIADTTIEDNSSGNGGNGAAAGFGVDLGGNGGGAGNGSAGGGLFASGGSSATLLNVTVDGNQVGPQGTPGAAGMGEDDSGMGGAPGQPAFGGGIYASTTPAIAVSNTLLGTNQLGNCAGNVSDGGHNLSFGSAGCPAGFLIGDPKLGPLADNGGPTETMALGAGSAAIDQVPSTGAGCPTDDQRGLPRPSGGGCDIGAYEVTPPAVSLGTADSVTSTGATLTGSVAPNAGSAEVHFEYGTTTSYGSNASAQSLPAGVQLVPVSASLSGLLPRTIYHYRLVAISPDGATTSSDATFETGAPRTKGAANGPRLSGLTVNPSRFHARKPGTTINYADSLAARTTFVVLSVRHGAERGGHCASSRRSSGDKSCKRLVKLGSFTHADQAGINTLHFSGRVKSRTLRPGRYLLEATASLDGVTGNTVSVPFRVA